jgi:hypothetical protein
MTVPKSAKEFIAEKANAARRAQQMHDLSIIAAGVAATRPHPEVSYKEIAETAYNIWGELYKLAHT